MILNYFLHQVYGRNNGNLTVLTGNKKSSKKLQGRDKNKGRREYSYHTYFFVWP